MPDSSALGPPQVPVDLGPDPRSGQELPTVAALCSSYFPGSHSQHTVDRFLMGYEYNGEMHYPPFRVVSTYVDQEPDRDLSRFRAEQFGVELCPDITAALTLGTGKLAVDHVLLVCENGDYPTNEKGQVLYPRYEFFREVVEVFRASGRTVPVFNDKHLSYDWEKARWMYDQVQELQIPMLAGSSLPVTWRLPDLELPLGCELEEAVATYPDGVETYGIHVLEMLQAMVERRKGGETGIKAVQFLEGDAVWQAARDGRWSRSLFEEAMARNLPRSIVEVQPTWTREQLASAYTERGPVVAGTFEEAIARPAAFLLEYNDGLRAACILLDGAGDFNTAVRHRDGRVDSTLHFLPGGPESAYHGIQVHHIEELFLNGRPNYPVERTLLGTGALAFLMDSRVDGQRRLETPELAVSYQVGETSQHAQGPMPFHCPWAPHGLYEPLARGLGVWPEED